MGLSACAVCGASQIEHDPTSGSSFCTVCGAVLEENTIVSELTFGETDAGQAILHGQFVSDKGVVSISSGSAGSMPRRLGSLAGAAGASAPGESREITLANARRRIQQLAAAVSLSEQYVDMAHRWFILALQHNFTRGRKGTSVSAACLYIVCRMEKTSHMLLDFSEILRVNVFLLGNVFLRLVHALNLSLPLVDPSLYMGRFASRLEFGDKCQQVANTALRIAARMKRDWIQTGRKPSGICGACLLVAARLWGFQRTQAEVISVVKVCEATVRRRLVEFSTLPSSQLTPQEFHTIWLEQEQDPPIFTLSKQQAQQLREAEEASKKGRVEFLTPAEEEADDLEADVQRILESEDLHAAEQETVLMNQDNYAEELESGLSDLDADDEVMNAVRPADEQVVKEQIWNSLNADYKDPGEPELEEPSEGTLAPVKRPAGERQKKREPVAVAESALQAVEVVIDAKKASKKLNYAKFDALFEGKRRS